jgi:hypothetical protein
MSLVFAFGTGLLVSWCSYQWASNPERAEQRAHEEAIVREGRLILADYVALGSELELSDPLERVREAGKVYIYPIPAGWEISGQYRRAGDSRWRPYLMQVDERARLISLAVDDPDPALAARAAGDDRFTSSRSP